MNSPKSKKQTSFSSKSSLPTELWSSDNDSYNENDHESMSLVKSVVSVRSKLSDMLYNTIYYQLRGDKLLRYEYSDFRSFKQKEFIEQKNSIKQDTYQGEISPTSAKNLMKKLDIWYNAIEVHNKLNDIALIRDQRRMVFLTCTLPANQIHSDEQIKLEILKPFLRILRDKYDCTNYVWKAESQENGRIHFHIVLDRYIHKGNVQSIWNKCTEKLGYITEFFKKFKHIDAPSTTIEQVYDYAGAKKYFAKYICKSDNYRKISGAVWKASKTVLSLQFFEFVSDSEVELMVNKQIEEKKVKVFTSERYEIIDFKGVNIYDVLPMHIMKLRYQYNELLTTFLFSNMICQDFRTYCFLFSEHYEFKEVDRIEIAKKDYPIQLSFNFGDYSEFMNAKKFMS